MAANTGRDRMTDKQKAVCDCAWRLVERVRQLEKEGDNKALPSYKLQPYINELADAVYDAEW